MSAPKLANLPVPEASMEQAYIGYLSNLNFDMERSFRTRDGTYPLKKIRCIDGDENENEKHSRIDIWLESLCVSFVTMATALYSAYIIHQLSFINDYQFYDLDRAFFY